MAVANLEHRGLGIGVLSTTASLRVDVCICTYHRPTVVDTLRAIAEQRECDAISLRVLVVDNAAGSEAETAICEAGMKLGLDLTYIHAPANNISIARNACLDNARGEWVAFLDDDETPSQDWLKELIEEAQLGDWHAVLGPVQAIYPETAPRWIQDGDFHSTKPVWVRGRIETGYTGNVLLRREVIERENLRFRVELGRSGGEDVDFFYRLRDAGGRIGFAANAWAHEPVPATRTGLRWLLRRGFRRGQTHGARLEAVSDRLRRAFELTVAFAKAWILGLGAVACLPSALPRNRLLTRAALHCGVVARLLGVSEIKLY